MAVDTINLDEEQKRMAEANDKAKRDKNTAFIIEKSKFINNQNINNQIINDQEKKIAELLKGLSPEDVAALSMKDYKPKEDNNHEEYVAREKSAAYPEVRFKEDDKTGIDAYNDHIKDDMDISTYTYKPGDYGYVKHGDKFVQLGDPSQYKYNGIGGVQYTAKKSREKEYPDILTRGPKSLPLAEKPKPEDNLYLKQAMPEVNAALKAIADRDPEAMMLPEVRELLQRSRDGYNKQIGIAAVAPWTNNPEQTMTLANYFREQGDKNLMDAANNLETIRTRQLDATKAMADDLTRQKSNLINMHGQVLGMEGNLAQVAIPEVQQANDLSLQAESIHEQGDNAINAAITNMKNFVQRLNDMGIPEDKVAVLNNEAKNLNAANIKNFINVVKEFTPNTNRELRKEFNERLNDISGAVATYETAMVNSNKLKHQAQFHASKAKGLMGSASTLGGKYKIPEWATDNITTAIPETEEPKLESPKAMDNPKEETLQEVPEDVQTNNVPSNNAGVGNKTINKNTKPASVSTKIDPGNMEESFNSNMSVNAIVDNIYAIAEAARTKGSKGSRVHVWYSTKGPEGEDVTGQTDAYIKNASEAVKGAAGSLANFASDPRYNKKAYNVLKELYRKGNQQYDELINSLPEKSDQRRTLEGLKGQFRSGASIDNGRAALNEQYATIADLLNQVDIV